MSEALTCYRNALEIDPDFGDAQWNTAIASLYIGDYAEGFKYFESRFYAGDMRHAEHLQGVSAMMAGKPAWMGKPMHGKALLVWTEQGFGDSLMFMRFLPELRMLDPSRVLVACEPEMLDAMATLSCVDEVVSKEDPLSPEGFDLHCSLLSLPHLLGTTLANLPARVPYLIVPDEMKDFWRSRVAALSGLRVGLVWAGGRQLANDALRSLPLKAFGPLFDLPSISFVNLQKGEPAAELAELQWPVVDWMDECDDFLDTAALVDALDLVISADTAVAHLAGALGKPVWLLNRFESEWRWMLGREDSPWYPSMRIFTQPALHDWATVMAKIRHELLHLS